MKRKRKHTESPDLGTKTYRCAYCGHTFERAWSDIFDMQETTHGYVGYEYDECDEFWCPQCHEYTSPNEASLLAQEGRQVKLPKILKADMGRAFIHAYYRYVCRCYSVSIDWELFTRPFVAVGVAEERMWFMDFSSSYEFPAEMKQATVNRRMLERTQEVLREAKAVGENGREGIYEVWCFTPPSQRLCTALEWTRQNGGQVTLVTPEQVQERVRQTVLAVHTDDVDAEQQFQHAFVQAALMFRQAFKLQ